MCGYWMVVCPKCGARMAGIVAYWAESGDPVSHKREICTKCGYVFSQSHEYDTRGWYVTTRCTEGTVPLQNALRMDASK